MKKYSIIITIIIILIIICSILLVIDNGNNDNVPTVQNIEVSSIALNKISLSLVEGESETINATILPIDATYKEVIWESRDNSIATIEKGKVVAVKAGSTIITARTSNNKVATCEVLVKPKVIEVESVSLNKSTLSFNVGESDTLIATVSPDNATDKSVTWESSDSSIATVENGKVVGVKAGTVTITVKSNNGKTASCSVTVKAINYEFSCSGKVDTDGTNIKVTGDHLDAIKTYTWNLNGKVVEGKNAYKNAKKGYTKVSVTLTLNDGQTKKVKCSIKDKLPYHFEENNGSPLYSTGYCGKISDEENERLNNELYEIIDSVGRGTRAGVVEAGRFLMGNIPYIIAYQGTGGNNIYTAGLHFGTQTNSWGCRKNGYINGMDCTGFMNWAFNTNGIKRTYSNKPTPVEGNIDKIRVGDVLVTYDVGQKPVTGIPFGHDEVIIGIDKNYIYTMSNGLTMTSIKDPPSPATNCRNGDCFDGEHHNAYYRNVIYANGDGKLTDMWIEW